MHLKRYAIACVIYNCDRSQLLLVQRPADDPDLPNTWGLPAGSLRGGETFLEAVKRAGQQKLGVDLVVKERIGYGEIERPVYTLYMEEYEAQILTGKPQVPQKYRGMTQYQSWRWGKSEELLEAADKGSLCSRIYLKSIGLWDEKI